MKLPHAVFTDTNGFVDRECPSCNYPFKIKGKDWTEKLFNEDVCCPRCSAHSRSDNWWTKDQITLIKQLFGYASNNGDTLYLHRSMNGKLGGISAYSYISYHKDKKTSLTNNRIGQKTEWENTVKCTSCSTVFKVIGTAFYCPCCSFNNVLTAFEPFIIKSKNALLSLNEMAEYIRMTENSEESDIFKYDILKDIFIQCTLAFSSFAYSLYCKTCFGDAKESAFSDIKRASRSFKHSCGFGFDSFISEDKLDILSEQFGLSHDMRIKKRKNRKGEIVTPRRITTNEVNDFVDDIYTLYCKMIKHYYVR